MSDSTQSILSLLHENLKTYEAIIEKIASADSAKTTLQNNIVLHLSRLAQVQDEVIDLRVKKILNEDRPYLPRIETAHLVPSQNGASRSASEIGRYFCNRRKQLVSLLQSLPQSEWIRTGLHELEGHITLEEFVRRMGSKDSDQISELARLTGYARRKTAEPAGE